MSKAQHPSAFEELQADFMARLGAAGFAGLESGTMVVLPSVTFPDVELRKITGIQYYEQRLLCLLLLLEVSDLHIVYVTSTSVEEAIVDYYLSFLSDPGVARKRIEFADVGDPKPRALTAKVLERPDAVDRLRSLIPNPGAAFIFPFNVTHQERRLAEALGVPLFGPHPDLTPLGSKSGSRRTARAAGVPVLDGAEDLWSLADVEKAIIDLRARNPNTRSVVIKLNNGFSGQGNAILDLAHIESPVDLSPTVFCAEAESWPSFKEKIAAEGAIVEELIREPGATSPSVQLRISPGGDSEVQSTHDQILGGPDDQVYLGCRFPARPDYRNAIQTSALKVADVLASHGVMGQLGIDFVVVPDGSQHRVYLTEINMRVGGTTHPFLMARYVTDGEYDLTSGELRAGGRAKHYVASDNLKSAGYVGMSPQQAVGVIEGAGLAYDASTRTGATLHLLGALREFGKLGTVCIADSPEDAQHLYEAVSSSLDEAAAEPASSG